MFEAICKVFGFVLRLFTKVVNAIAEAVRVIGTATIDVLGDLTDAVLGSFNPLIWIGLGLGLLWLLNGDEKETLKEVMREAPRLSSI